MSGLVHYSHAPVQLDDRQPEQSLGMKPSGLWVSVGTGWLDWCRDEQFRTDQPWFAQEVTVSVAANILTLASPGDLDAFTHSYGQRIAQKFDSHYIDWVRVAAEYDGILISPYQWSRRNAPHTFWYYGWDCASGCIWNMSVASLDEAAETPLALASGEEG